MENIKYFVTHRHKTNLEPSTLCMKNTILFYDLKKYMRIFSYIFNTNTQPNGINL